MICYNYYRIHIYDPTLLMGVSENRGTQNGWFIMEDPIKMDDLGGKPTIFGNILIAISGLISKYSIPNP